MDWFRGQTIFRRRPRRPPRTGKPRLQMKFASLVLPPLLLLLLRNATQAGRGPPGHSSDRPKSKFVVGKTVQMSPEHATRSFLRRLPPSLDRRRDRRRRGKREEGRKDGLHRATEVIREGRRAHRRKEDDEFAVSPLLLLPSSSSASTVRRRRVRAIK